ncbi:Uma2 family endonuclease [Actinomadura sp. NTSP31]|uniref:Uma2 family endonuclease n=1 Tax=Actinomadura sp. NTSP31 TaxID=1735447 RepID=UPI0035C18035
MEPEALPDWVIPPPDGFTADDFLRMRGLPRHTELIDGALVFARPQRKWHSRIVNLIRGEIDRQAAHGWRAERGMAVRLADRQVPVPDVAVVTAEAYEREQPDDHYFGEDLLLAVEAVDPGSEDRDRHTKPVKYAAAGIEHFWRVEDVDGRTVVFVHELDHAARSYRPPSVHCGRLEVSVPFDIEVDLGAVGARW